MTEPLLVVDNLKVYYYTLTGIVKAVDGVSFSVPGSELAAVVGESGSGKTTLGYSILGLIPPPGRRVSGRILIDNVDITSLHGEALRRARGELVSMVFQNPFTTLDPVRRVGDQVVEVMTEHGVPKDEAWRRAEEIFTKLGLPPRLLKAYPHQLSGGQRQRVAIAAAVALNPKLVVADEPTTALDVIVQEQIMELLDSLRRQGMTIMLITHDIALAATWATKVIVMYAGTLVEYGSVEEVVGEPLHPYTRGLINATPSVDRKDRPKSIPGLPPDLRRPPPGCRFHPRCPYAMDKCRKEPPTLIEASPGHYVSCHLYTEGRR